jgi:predicted lipoprotein with Yx(FWY)xxD motif
MRHPRIVIGIAALAVAAGVGGIVAATAGGSTTPTASGSAHQTTTTGSGSATPPTSAPNGTAPTASATIHVATTMVGGSTEAILENSSGLPLYFYKPDTSTRSMVSGSLAAAWPPLVDATLPTASGAAGSLEVVDTSNGHQVSYNGHFLYTFVQDSPGNVTGQGVSDFFVATPGLAAGHAGPSSVTTTTAPASTGKGYNY